MESVKDRMTRIIEAQPDDATYDEILRELAFERMVQRGLEDVRAGRTLSDEEARRRIASWQR
jgi:predicted transcriptional regulator